MKKVWTVVGIGLAVVCLAVGLAVGLWWADLGGGRPLIDGAELPGGATLVRDGHVSMLLLPTGAGEVALIDCGDDLEATALLGALRQRGLGPEAVRAVFLTHGHADHIAGCARLPRAEVLAFGEDAALAEGLEAGKGPLPKLMGRQTEKRVRVTRALKDGERVQVGSLTVSAYKVPGHTAGSAAYLARGVLHLGDSATGRADGSLRSTPWLFSDDAAQSRESLRRLVARLQEEGAEVKVLAFSHSGPVEGGLAPLVGAALAR